MALGFDMADPIFKPPVTADRVNDWKTFLNGWAKKPVFAGRYFGGANTWVFGEIPSDLKARVPSFFDDLKYIWVLTGTGPYSRTRWVNIDGDLLAQNVNGILVDANGDPLKDQLGGAVLVDEEGRLVDVDGHQIEYLVDVNGNRINRLHPVFFQQQGETEDGTKLPATQVRALGQRAARSTCKAIAKQVERLDPFSPPVDLELPGSRIVLVFLDVEPQTKLHKEYWRGWAETVSSYTSNAGTALQPELVQPFWPALYCAMDNGPRLPAVRDVFANKGSPLCFAVATGWNPTPPGPIFPTPADALTATEADVQTLWPDFGNLEQPLGRVGMHVVKWQVPVVIWQYKLNIFLTQPANPSIPFEIDLAATSANAYDGMLITDFMLKIIW